MAQLALTAAAAVGGAAIAVATGGVGAAALGLGLGAMAGGVLGAAFLPQRVQGTQLWDVRPMYASYGTPIPIGFGTVRVPGTLIWATILEGHKTRYTGKGNLMGPEVYTYTASFAVSFGRGVIADVLTIFADTMPIFNKVAGLGTGYVAQPYGYIGPQLQGQMGNYAGQTVVGAGIVQNGAGGYGDVSFRIYTGTETQMPDPAISADPRVGPPQDVPAFRGLAYIVFDNLELAAFGNRIPSISAVITYQDGTSELYQLPTAAPSYATGLTPVLDEFGFAVDPNRQALYSVGAAQSDGKYYLIETSLPTMQQTRVVPAEDILTSGDNVLLGGYGENAMVCDGDGYLYASDNSGSGTLVKIDLNTMKQVGQLAGISNVIYLGLLPTLQANAAVDYLIVSTYPNSALRGINATSMVQIWSDGWNTAPQFSGSVAGVLPLPPTIGAGSAYIPGYPASGVGANQSSTSPVEVFLLTVTGGDIFGTTGAPYPANWDLANVGSIPPAQVGALIPPPASGAWDAWWAFVGWGATSLLDPADNGIVMFAQLGNGTGSGAIKAQVVFKWQPATGTVVWASTFAGIAPVLWTIPQNVFGSFSWFNGSQAATLNLGDGTLSYLDTPDLHTANLNYQQYFNGASGAVVATASSSQTIPAGLSNGVARIFANTSAGASATVGEIIQSLGEEVGFQPSDFDISALGMSIAGYLVQSPQTAADAIAPLEDVFFFNLIESDGLLKGVLRNNAPVRTLTQDYLSAESGNTATGEWFRERRVQDVDLPQTQTLTFLYPTNGLFESMTVMAQRMIAPLRAMHSSMKRGDARNVVLEETAAQDIAYQMLYEGWIERSTYTFGTDWTNLDLDPNDVVQVQMDDGTLFTTRVMRADVGANMAIEFAGVSTSAGVYNSTTPTPLASMAQLPPTPSGAPVRLFVFDIPLLRDQDDLAGAASCVYFGAGAHSSVTGFTNSIVLSSPDTVTWTQIGACTRSATWGSCITALPDAPGEFAWDTATQLHVVFSTVADAPASVSDSAVLTSFRNAFLVSTAGNGGGWEIIQAANVVANGDGSYTLSRLLRGRRGSDAFAVGHAAGDQIVYVEAGPLDTFQLALGDLNKTRYYKAVPAGTLMEAAPVAVAINTGRDLMPYAPEQIAASLDGSSDIVLTWARRTRIGGELQEGIGTVPLSEASESYSIDIMSGPGGTVKRTLTATTPTVTYPNAEVIADFGSVPAELTVHVYQISAVVGRGFTHEVTVAT